MVVLFFYSCTNATVKNNKEIGIDTLDFESKGYAIFNKNCSGCHSFKTDTTFSKLTLFDLSERNPDSLYHQLQITINDSIHKEKILIQNNEDARAVQLYITQSFRNGRL
ncbi:MAG: hypothetical protein ACN6O7_00410 [Sphingobacterium sp.]